MIRIPYTCESVRGLMPLVDSLSDSDLTAEQRAARDRMGSAQPQLSDSPSVRAPSLAPSGPPSPEVVVIPRRGDSDLTAEQRATRDRIASPLPSFADFVNGTAGPHEVAAPPSEAHSQIVFPSMPKPVAPPPAPHGISFGGGGAPAGPHEVALISPEREHALERAQMQAQGIAEEQGAAQQQAEIDKAKALQEQSDAANREAERVRLEAEEHQRFADEWAASTKKDLDKLQKEKGINPDRWWDSQETGAKVGYGFAAAIAGFGMGWNHQNGPNPVVESISQHTAADIRAQEQNYERHKDVADRKNTLYAHMYAITGDKDAAFAKAFSVATQAQIDKANAIAARNQGNITGANAEAVANQLKQNMIQTGINSHKLVQGGGGGFTAEQIAKARQHVFDAAVARGEPLPTGDALDKDVAYLLGGNSGALTDVSKRPTGAGAVDVGGIEDIANKAAGVKAGDTALSFLPSWMAPGKQQREAARGGLPVHGARYTQVARAEACR